MEKQVRKIDKTASAYSYPLLIKQLLHTPILYAPDQEIVYRDQLRFTYRDLYRRINRLASALDSLGVGPGTPSRSWTGIRIVTWSVSLPFP